MRLEHLCDMELAYREESLYQGKFIVARPYDSQLELDNWHEI